MFFRRKSSLKAFLTEENRERLREAIEAAEKETSGEIRVHVESRVPKGKTPLERSVDLFDELGMRETRRRNGILIYVALDDRKFAIFGDAGIDEKVGPGFWDHEKNEMENFFRRGDLVGGIEFFIGEIGTKLAEFFPWEEKGDENELSDEISVGE
jgi:uncharacterized membrane protein